MQQIPNTYQSTNLEEVFSALSVQLRDATIEELLEEVFSMRSVPRRCKQDLAVAKLP
jgi:hypothetical protein